MKLSLYPAVYFFIYFLEYQIFSSKIYWSHTSPTIMKLLNQNPKKFQKNLYSVWSIVGNWSVGKNFRKTLIFAIEASLNWILALTYFLYKGSSINYVRPLGGGVCEILTFSDDMGGVGVAKFLTSENNYLVANKIALKKFLFINFFKGWFQNFEITNIITGMSFTMYLKKKSAAKDV